MFRFNLNQLRDEVVKTGFARSPQFITESEAEILMNDLKIMEAQNYTEEHLKNNSALYSDSTETRVSHAMMISLEPSVLPTVPLLGQLLKPLLAVHNEMLEAFLGHRISPSSRSMLNFQWYKGSSKEVAEHFDGHYIKYKRKSPTEFELEEGILPQYVFVITLANENSTEPQGTKLRDTLTNTVHTPLSHPGDLLVFNNIRFRHSVPELSLPRAMLGFRCFDEDPLLFQKTPSAGRKEDFVPLPDLVNPGYIRNLSTAEATNQLRDFYERQWPINYLEMKQSGGLF